MKTRRLRDLEVSAIGMGCMGFSTAYGKTPEEKESIRLMREAHDWGCNFYDTAEIYATYRNEELVGKALKPIRNEIVLSTKYSPAALMGQEQIAGGKLSRNGVRFAIENSKARGERHSADRPQMRGKPRFSASTVKRKALQTENAWTGGLAWLLSFDGSPFQPSSNAAATFFRRSALGRSSFFCPLFFFMGPAFTFIPLLPFAQDYCQ